MKTFASAAALVGGMALGSFGCIANAPTGTSEVVGPDGASLEVNSEAGSTALDVPAGALVAQVEISVQPIQASQIAEVGETATVVGEPVAFTPHGTQFEAPVTIAFTVPGGLGANAAIARLADESDSTWEMLPSTRQGETISVEVTSFSIYAVIELAACTDIDGDGVCDDFDPCPTDNPDDSDGNGVCDSAQTWVTGTISYLGTPYENATVNLTDFNQQIVGTTMSDASGAYQIPILTSGTYYLDASVANPCLVGYGETTVTLGSTAVADVAINACF